jgi:hypothetical protein
MTTTEAVQIGMDGAATMVAIAATMIDEIKTEMQTVIATTTIDETAEEANSGRGMTLGVAAVAMTRMRTTTAKATIVATTTMTMTRKTTVDGAEGGPLRLQAGGEEHRRSRRSTPLRRQMQRTRGPRPTAEVPRAPELRRRLRAILRQQHSR